MIRDNRRFATIPFIGGMDLESTPLKLSAGTMILCQNFEVKAGGGYSRPAGYERFDGQPSPSAAEDVDAARALILKVPGSGPVRGLRLFQGKLYAFRNTLDGLAAKLYSSSGSGWEEVVTPALLPGGNYEIISHNFYGATSLERMYGVDGVNPPFMFDGTTFTQLSVTGATAPAEHIAAHSNHLFLSYPQGQYVHSGIGDPTDYDAVSGGAGSGGTGDDIVAIRPAIGGALAFFMRNKVSMLYGSSKADWSSVDLRKQQDESGAIAGTIQDLGDLFYLDDRGITSLQQTQAFGNFRSSTIDQLVKRFVQQRKSKVLASYISRTRNQYKLCFEYGSGTEVLSLTLNGGQIDGYGRSVFPFKVTSITSQEDESGTERIFAGSDDGFVYELDRGTSFDGAEIESYAKLSFAHLGTPNRDKRYRYLVLGLEAESSLTLRVKPEFDYGSIDRAGHRVVDASIIGDGGQWDNSNWNEFTWSAQIVSEAKLDVTGTGRNMAILIYHKSNDTKPFTIYDATIQYSMRGVRR